VGFVIIATTTGSNTMSKDPFRDADRATTCPKCGEVLSWNKEDGLKGQQCGCGYTFTGRERNRRHVGETYLHCPDCGKPTLRLIENTDRDSLGNYREVRTCDECENIVYIVRGFK